MSNTRASSHRFGGRRQAAYGARRADRPRRGSATMEVAVVLPLLLVTTIGLVDFGRAAYEAIEVENAAHAGASFGSRSKTSAANTGAIEAAARADFGDRVDTSAVAIESERYCECAGGGDIACEDFCSGTAPLVYVRVRVERQFQTLLSYPGIPEQIDLAREVHMRVR